MSNYNLIHSGLIETNTSGTKQLNTEELTLLYDGNTVTSGVTLIDTDILYIDIDLYNRVNVEDFKLYINVPDRQASLVSVNFYYKNNIIDDYTLCSKEQDIDAFYPINLPELFAPRFCRIVIDSLECTILEISLTNDDDQVAFGEDGNQSLVTVDHTYGNYTTLPIFNNAAIDTPVVNAYVLVDYQENESDFYLTLSPSFDGEYEGLADGAFIKTDDTSFKYTWSRGMFDGTVVIGDTIQTDPNYYGSTYNYTTPVVSLGDPLMSSFLITRQTITSGTNITWGDPNNKSTVKVFSSNTAPIAFTKFFITSTSVDFTVSIYKADLANGALEEYKTIQTTSTADNTVLFDKTSGTFLILLINNQVVRYKYNEASAFGAITYSTSSTDNKFKDNWAVDGYGNVWGYVSNSGYKLRFLNGVSLEATTVLTDAAIPFVTDLAVNLRYASCWFTDPGVKMLKHVDADGVMLVSKSMNNPTYLTSLYDGGCLVVDVGTTLITRVDYFGETIAEINFSSIYEIIDIDYSISEESTTALHERFWVLTHNGYVFQYTFDGLIISEARYISATSIHAFLGGCLIHCTSLNKTYQLNSNGEQTRVWDYTGLDTMGPVPCPIDMSYEEYLEQAESASILPINSDPVWGVGTDIDWKEVKSDGYLLPFANYHQLKYNFTPLVINDLCLNGDFETGDLTGWVETNSGFEITTIDPREGSYCLRLIQSENDGTVHRYIDLSTYTGIDFDLLDNNLQGYVFNVNYWIKKNDMHYTSYYSTVTVEFYDTESHEIDNTSLYAKHGYEISDGLWYNEWLQSKVPSGTRFIKIIVYSFHHVAYNSQAFDGFKAQLMHSPELDLVGVPKPIKLEDIMPQTSKNIYLKTDFPPGTANSEYVTQLKCWWGSKEE